MILYTAGQKYWHEMKKFNASKTMPGMAVHTVYKLTDLLAETKSEAVKRRINSFIDRHAPRATA